MSSTTLDAYDRASVLAIASLDREQLRETANEFKDVQSYQERVLAVLDEPRSAAEVDAVRTIIEKRYGAIELGECKTPTGDLDVRAAGKVVANRLRARLNDLTARLLESASVYLMRKVTTIAEVEAVLDALPPVAPAPVPPGPIRRSRRARKPSSKSTFKQ